MIRRLVPFLLLPLALIACALAAAPWLRAFPADVISVPLFGAALLSVVAPAIVVGIGVRRLWVTALFDVVLFVLYELFVTLRDPSGYSRLWTGLVHGPAQILSFALPLVSPRELLVAPVALCWLAGAVVGECIARSWNSLVPYLVLLVAFGMAYAATTRAITGAVDGRRYDTLLAAALLLTLLLLRAAQSWVVQERSASSTQIDGALPLRGLTIGVIASVVVALAAAGAVQSDAFAGRPTAPARTPPLNRSQPLTPVSFVSGLRPTDTGSQGPTLFDVTVDRPSSNYVSLATVDSYDGTGWSFQRTFRPSGGVVPAEDDPALRSTTRSVTQSYSILAGPMTTAPWMPYLNRATKISGIAVNVDAASGMVVPATRLRAGTTYTVQSSTSPTPFGRLPGDAQPAQSGPASDVQLPGTLTDQLAALITTLERETQSSRSRPVQFLQRVADQFRNDALSGGPRAAASPTPTPTPTPTSSASPSSSVSSPTSGGAVTGGTGFADVLASIRQNRSATPEQYATLTALIARALGVHARVVAGFRITAPDGSATLPAGRYAVHAAEAWTWVEIPVDGVGWSVLDASPGTYSGKDTRTSASPSASSSAAPPQSVAISSAADSGVSRGQAAPGIFPGSHDLSGAVIALIVTGAVLVALLGFLVVLLIRKRLRYRRRRAGADPVVRVVGAWQETLDLLVESGLPELDHLTGAEVTKLTGERFGDGPAAHVDAVGDAANVAIFGPASWTGDTEADDAWRTHTQLRRDLRRSLGRRAALRASLRHHRRRRTGPLVGPESWLADHEVWQDGPDPRSGSVGLKARRRARRIPARRAR